MANPPARWRWWYAFAAVLLSSLAIAGTGIVYTNSVAKRINSEWCDVAVPVSDAYKENPPQTEAAKALQRAMEDKRRRFC